jgi:hypothetical protein
VQRALFQKALAAAAFGNTAAAPEGFDAEHLIRGYYTCSTFKNIYQALLSYVEHPVSGLLWKEAGATQPTQGRELINPALGRELERTTEFTQQEWSAFGVGDLRPDHFIQAGGSYFRPRGSADVPSVECKDYKLGAKQELLYDPQPPSKKGAARALEVCVPDSLRPEVSIVSVDGVQGSKAAVAQPHILVVARLIFNRHLYQPSASWGFGKWCAPVGRDGTAGTAHELLEVFRSLDQDGNGRIRPEVPSLHLLSSSSHLACAPSR